MACRPPLVFINLGCSSRGRDRRYELEASGTEICEIVILKIDLILTEGGSIRQSKLNVCYLCSGLKGPHLGIFWSDYLGSVYHKW